MRTSHRLIALLTGASVSAPGIALPAHAAATVVTSVTSHAPTALDQLTGASYASYLSSFNSLGVHYNDILAKATDCEIPALAGSLLECRTSPSRIWAQIDYQHRRTDGEAAGYEADRWSGLVGLDMNVGSAAIAGFSVGKVGNRVGVDPSNAVIRADGHQLGAYGLVDPGPFYAQALGTYSWFDGDGERNIVPFGSTVEGEVTGDPDIKMWTLGLHGGYRMAMGASSVLTPYLNVGYTNVKMGSFTEAGQSNPGLIVEGGKETRTTLTGGVKWAGEIAGTVPEANLGYRYQFGDRRSSFTARLSNDETSDFGTISAGEERGELLAGLSLGAKVGPVAIRTSYEALFNGQSTSHAGNFKLVLPLGGDAALPPELQYFDLPSPELPPDSPPPSAEPE